MYLPATIYIGIALIVRDSFRLALSNVVALYVSRAAEYSRSPSRKTARESEEQLSEFETELPKRHPPSMRFYRVPKRFLTRATLRSGYQARDPARATDRVIA